MTTITDTITPESNKTDDLHYHYLLGGRIAWTPQQLYAAVKENLDITNPKVKLNQHLVDIQTLAASSLAAAHARETIDEPRGLDITQTEYLEKLVQNPSETLPEPVAVSDTIKGILAAADVANTRAPHMKQGNNKEYYYEMGSNLQTQAEFLMNM